MRGRMRRAQISASWLTHSIRPGETPARGGPRATSDAGPPRPGWIAHRGEWSFPIDEGPRRSRPPRRSCRSDGRRGQALSRGGARRTQQRGPGRRQPPGIAALRTSIRRGDVDLRICSSRAETSSSV